MSQNGADQTTSSDINKPQITTPPVNGTQEESQQKKVNLSSADLQVLVMQAINHVNAKKDELTIATKQLGDLATQLSKICSQQNEKIKELSS